MVINIGEKSEGSFANPMGLLNGCHRRIERFLILMVTVAGQAKGADMDEAQKTAVASSLRYFREAAPKHTQDEEESLFPRLSHSQDPEGKAVLSRLEELKKDHAIADETHREVEGLMQRWLEEGRLSPQSAKRLTEALDKLSDLYRRHIHLEESELFPFAERALEKSAIEAIGREMAARRGVDPERTPVMPG
jgi:hemerythrin-like domain-containing protein